MSYLIKSVSKAPEFSCDWNAWNQAETTQLTNVMPQSSSHHPPVAVRLLHDHDTIYGIFQTKDQYVIANQLNYQNEVCTDSCVEFFFKPSTGPGYFNLEMSAGGAYLFFYIRYTLRQEHMTPHCQEMLNRLTERFGDDIPADIREEFVRRSRPMMPACQALTFDLRIGVLYLTALLNCVWVYFLFEGIVLQVIFFRLRHRHEQLCADITAKL